MAEKEVFFLPFSGDPSEYIKTMTTFMSVESLLFKPARFEGSL